MKKALIILSLVLLVVASVATPGTLALAAEQPSLCLFGNYTIRDDGLVSYELRMDGDKVCYLGFTIQTDLRILEIQTDGSAFHEIIHEGNKVIAYSFGNVNADHAMVIKVVLEAPNPDQNYEFDLGEVQAYNFAEQQLIVTTYCPMIEVQQEEAPPATEPSTSAPTEPAATDPKPTNPNASDSNANTQPSTKPQSGNSGNANIPAAPQGDGEIIDMNQIDSVKAGLDGFLSKIDTLVQRNPPAFWGITTGFLIFFVILFATRDSKGKKDSKK